MATANMLLTIVTDTLRDAVIVEPHRYKKIHENQNDDDKIAMNMKICCKNNNNNGRPRLVFFDLQESSITEAVAKQLNATTMTQSLTPQMGKKGIPASGGGGGGGSSSGGGLTPSGGLLEQPVGTPMSGKYYNSNKFNIKVL